MAQPNSTQKDKFEGSLRTLHVIKADDNGELETKIELVKAGTWPNSVKGALKITKADLEAMKTNFDAGIGRPGNGELGLPIDFSHNEWDKAAGWINNLVVEGSTLFGLVQWSTDGKAAIEGLMYQCISPSFYPSDRGGYVDPEDYDSEAIPNTLVGAGLTNIPFFKGLSAVKADNQSDIDTDSGIIYIKANAKPKKEQPMTLKLDEIVTKENSAITADEREFLTDNADKLTADQKVKFGFEQAPQAEQFSTEDRQILADIKSGAKVIMSAAEKTALEEKVDASVADVKALKRKDIEASVTKDGIETGRIKADQLKAWSDLVEADAKNLDLLLAIPENKIVADKEKGDEGGEAKDQEEKIHAATVKIQAAARAKGESAPSYSIARKQAVQELKTQETK